MKKSFFLIILSVLFLKSHSQQWITKSYYYDSLVNVKYGTAINFNGGVDTLKMDIYKPICSDTISRRPLIMIIHGGAFIAGNRYDPNIIKMTRDFAKRGYVTADIEYRLGFISDDAAWTCTIPNYSCVFATDSAEWIRGYYRGVQDAKGALRYLINRNKQYRIDTNNVFVAGESAGGFIAMGVGFLDTISEKPFYANAITSAPPPNVIAQTCSYNVGKTFTLASIPRPDLGSIDGIIEPTTIKYKIKGVGNFYGAVANDIFKYKKFGSVNPALYLYHQPCDMVVPFNNGPVDAGFSWCMTNCYSCYAVANTPTVFGSNYIKNLITAGLYPITIFNDMTANVNPYNCLFGSFSCADQINNPCHEMDNYTLRTGNMATFFASKITTSPVCLPGSIGIKENHLNTEIIVSPNPFINEIKISNNSSQILKYKLRSVLGKQILNGEFIQGENTIHFKDHIESGMYFLCISYDNTDRTIKLICLGE